MPQQQFEDLNSGFIQELFEQYLRAPESVDPKWRALFEQTPEKLEASPVVRIFGSTRPDAADDAALARQGGTSSATRSLECVARHPATAIAVPTALGFVARTAGSHRRSRRAHTKEKLCRAAACA